MMLSKHVLWFPILPQEHAMLVVQVESKPSHAIQVFMNRVVLVTIFSAHCVQRVPSQTLAQILVQFLVLHVLLAFIPQVLLLFHVQHAVLGIFLRSSSKRHATRAHLVNGRLGRSIHMQKLLCRENFKTYQTN
jgi:hypothetical protein